MIQKEFSVEIGRPVHDVFAFVDDASRAPQWLGPCISLKQISPGPREVGTELHYTYRQAGQNGEMKGAVTAHQVDQRLTMKFRDEQFEVSLDFLFSPNSSGTTLKQITEIEPLSFTAKLMSGFIASATEKQLKQDMEKLKALLESGQGQEAPALPAK